MAGRPFLAWWKMSKRIYWSGWRIIKLGKKPLEGYQLRQYNRRNLRQKVQLGVLAVLEKLASNLAYGVPGTQLSKEVIDQILVSISENKTGYHLKWARNFFVLGISRGNREGIWNIDTPAPVMTMRRHPASFTPKHFETLGELRRLQSHFMATLQSETLWRLPKVEGEKKHSDFSNTRELRTGQIYFSAMAYGGLLDAELLTILPRHFQDMCIDGTWCWIDLYQSSNVSSGSGRGNETKENSESTRKLRRRWFVDPISELLLYRWDDDFLGLPALPKGKAACKKAIYRSVRRFFIETGFQPSGNFPPTLKALCQLASIDVGLRVPGFLAAYAKGEVFSQSLPPLAWLRLRKNVRGSAKIEAEGVRETEAIIVETIMPRDHWVDLDHYDQKELFRLLRKSFYRKRGENIISHPKAIHVIKQFVGQNRGRMAAPLHWLARWAVDLLENGTSHQKRVTVKTVYEYLGHAQSILIFMGNLDPAMLDREELETVYYSILNSTPTVKARCYKAGRLQEFQYFLNLHIRPVNIDFGGMSGCSEGGRVDVDANLITELEYNQAMNELKRYAPTEARMTSMRCLVLMLGYRLGLRRTEVWLLQLQHIIGHTYQELWVMSSANKKLKSPCARRRLSLNDSLTPDELKELLEWRDGRMSEEGLGLKHPNKKLLFCLEGAGGRPVPESELFDPIHTVLRAVTGDPSIRFHHGRHSLPNHRMIKLIQCKQAVRDGLSNRMSQHLYPLVSENSTRRNLFALAMALGHRSPNTTLQSYVHLCDLLLYCYLNEPSPELPMEVLVNLTGQNKDNLYKYRKRNHSDKILTEATLLKQRKVFAKRFEDPLTKTNHADVTEPIEWPNADVDPCLVKLQQEPTIPLLHQIIIHYDAAVHNEDYWANRWSYKKEFILCWVNVARTLAQCTSKRGTPRHIRPMWWNVAEGEGKAQVKQQHQTQPRALMPQPKRKADIADMNKTIEALRKLRCSQPELAKWAVDYYLDHNVASHSHVFMQSEKDAKHYVEFILALGFPKRCISIQFRPQQKPDSLPIGEQMAYWSKSLGIGSKYFKYLEAMTGHGPKMGSVHIAILNQSSEAEEKSSYGFAYALFMMGILMVSEGLCGS
jgi:integrase